MRICLSKIWTPLRPAWHFQCEPQALQQHPRHCAAKGPCLVTWEHTFGNNEPLFFKNPIQIANPGPYCLPSTQKHHPQPISPWATQTAWDRLGVLSNTLADLACTAEAWLTCAQLSAGAFSYLDAGGFGFLSCVVVARSFVLWCVSKMFKIQVDPRNQKKLRSIQMSSNFLTEKIHHHHIKFGAARLGHTMSPPLLHCSAALWINFSASEVKGAERQLGLADKQQPSAS